MTNATAILVFVWLVARENRTRMSDFHYEELSKTLSFLTVSLDLTAMFKIKSLLYKDLILNSLSAMLMGDGEKVTNFSRHPRRCY